MRDGRGPRIRKNGRVESDPVYSQTAATVIETLRTSARHGLSAGEAERRLAESGLNALPEPPRRHPVLRFLGFFNDVLIYILLGSAVLKALLAEWIDFWVIVAVALVNAVVGYLQEGKAEKAIRGIRSMLSPEAQVLRDGEWARMEATVVVRGDVIRVAPGDRVPADARILDAVELRCDEGALTGESEPAGKSSGPVPAEAGLGDRASMLYSGTIVTSGQGTAVVTATGEATEIGAIQAMAEGVDDVETPLAGKLRVFGTRLSLVVLALAAVMILIGRYVHGFGLDRLVSTAIGFAVAAIPEGLPALVTITLALGVQAMARRQAIIRRLTAVETLGALTVICSDKTGTLTKNEMTVTDVVTASREFTVSGTGYAPSGDVMLTGVKVDLAGFPDLSALVTTMARCNDARVVREGDAWALVGEPTEGALRTLSLKAGVEETAFRREAVLPFNSSAKYMATLDTLPDGGGMLFVKGAPDRLLARSSGQLGADGRLAPLDRDFWEKRIDELSGRGLRVLAAAEVPRPRCGSGTPLGDGDVRDLIFLGLVGIIDPPRPEAVEAIARCRSAGIAVTMITGDHAGTAVAVARSMGIIVGDGAPVLTGAEVEALSTEQLRAIVRDVHVFARTSPEHKIRIVSALQSRGEVVAMTGDGVNDAPALRKADVGIAMGIKGTEATKEAAEMVLADDDFSSIEHAVEEGRRIYDNLRKSIVFLLPTNGAQSLVVLLAALFGFAAPVEPTQVLWINMVTAVTLSLALAYEPAEPGLMNRPPRGRGEPLLDLRGTLLVGMASAAIAGATMAAYALARASGAGPAEYQTVAVQTLAFGQMFYLFNCRSLDSSSISTRALIGNRLVWLAAASLIGLQAVYVTLPPLNALFGSATVGPAGWWLPVVLGAVVFFVIEAAKFSLRRFGASRPPWLSSRRSRHPSSS